MRMLMVLLVMSVASCTQSVDVDVDTDKVVQSVDEDLYMGVTMDCYLMQDNWEGWDFSNTRMLNLAKGISPSLMRIGGTACDSLTFKPNGVARGRTRVSKITRPPFTTNFTMTGKDWDNWNMFVDKAGWKMIFGINAKKRTGQRWDPWNAIEIMQYTVQKGYPIYGFELSNEPNLFPKSIAVSPEQLGRDFVVLQGLLQSLSQFGKTLIIGPDDGGLDSYFNDFLQSDGGKVVNVGTFHHYYFNGRTGVLSQFTDPHIMDSLIPIVEKALGWGKAAIPGKPVWLGETSSAYNTGAPGISNTYVAGFLWMDKLGLSAKLGIKAVLRQDFYGGNYSLIHQNTFMPYPDYWLTLLYKKLVGGQVFNVSTNSDNSVRVYAHCAKQYNEYKYGAGSLVVYAINLKTSEVELNFPNFSGQQRDVFWLSSGTGSLTSPSVKLNGALIELVNDQVPHLLPVNQTTSVMAPPYSMGFIVYPHAGIKACDGKKKYHNVYAP